MRLQFKPLAAFLAHQAPCATSKERSYPVYALLVSTDLLMRQMVLCARAVHRGTGQSNGSYATGRNAYRAPQAPSAQVKGLYTRATGTTCLIHFHPYQIRRYLTGLHVAVSSTNTGDCF